MYKIILPSKLDGVRYGIQFINGVGTTGNERVADIMKSKGFEVSYEDMPDETETDEANEQSGGIQMQPYEDMPDEQLQQLAIERMIDTSKLKSRSSLIRALKIHDRQAM